MNSPGLIRLYHVAGLAVVLAALLVPRPGFAHGPDEQHRALLLLSYHPTFPTYRSVVRGVGEVLRDDVGTLDVEYLDAKRFAAGQTAAQLRDLLAAKLARLPRYDVVLLSDDPALDFALQQRERLFAGVPLVFMAVNDVDKAIALDGDPGVTGVVEQVSIAETLALARRLDPALEEVVAVVDGTESGRADLELLGEPGLLPDGVRTEVLDLRTLSWPELAERLAKLPPHRAVLRLTAFSDRHGTVLDMHEGMHLLAESSPAPVYHLRDVGMGAGAVGGVLVNFEQQGRRAAMMAERVLAGVPVAELPVLRSSPNVTMVEYAAMRRFGFDLGALPTAAVVVGRPFSLLREYPTETGVAVAVFALLAIGLLVMVALHAARRRAERRLAESEQRFRAMVEGTDYGVLVHRDRKPVFANQAYARLFGYDSPEQLLALDSVDQLYAPHEVARLHDYFRARAAGRSAPSEYDLEGRRRDGSPVHLHMVVHGTCWEGAFAVQQNAVDVGERRRAEQLLRDSENRYRALVEHAPEAIVLYDVDAGRLVDVNDNACRLFGLSRAELLSSDLAAFCETRAGEPGQGPEALRAQVDHALAGEAAEFSWGFRHASGRTVPTEVRLLRLPAGERRLVRGSITDLSEWRQAQRALADKSAQLEAILENVHQGICMVDAELRVLAFNHRYLSLLDQPPGRLREGEALAGLLRQGFTRREQECADVERDVAQRLAAVQNREPYRLLLTRRCGKVLEEQGQPLPDGGMVMTLTDITETHRLSEQLSHQARHDPLTELPNRREFESRLGALLDSAREQGARHALCYLDLDQFKVINDTCGHAAGDELLRQLAQTLRRRVRRRDTLARLGGDEFGVLLEGCSVAEARRIAESLRAAVEEFRFSWSGNLFRIGVSVGLVPLDTASGDSASVLSRVDAACYAAKDQGRNRIHVYDEEDRDFAERHGEMRRVVQIQAALDEDRFDLLFQPIVPLAGSDGAGRHCELLLRMRDADGTVVPPGAFLPAAERYNLISRIDRWVVCAALARLAEPGCPLQEFEVCSINLSGQSLVDDSLLLLVQERLRATGVPASRISFEITETAAIANLARATHFITTLKSLGCRFALDDFGSGLSSFAYLKSLPVDYLKIDGLFIKDIVDDPIDRAMVRSINEIAHVMGKHTIAEFVENGDILAMLQEIGVDYAQGYGIARPQPLTRDGHDGLRTTAAAAR